MRYEVRRKDAAFAAHRPALWRAELYRLLPPQLTSVSQRLEHVLLLGCLSDVAVAMNITWLDTRATSTMLICFVVVARLEETAYNILQRQDAFLSDRGATG
jgi:hypothetical protein